MCTALSYKTQHHYFGRNLDLERGYGEKVIITPRNFVFDFRFENQLSGHYALIGMGVDAQNFPLYFEATNEKGLSMAGLNFPKNAHYMPFDEKKLNIAPFELIPYILSLCKTVTEAEKLLKKINVISCNFSVDMPASPLHWMISDKEKSVTLECTKEGMKVYENPFGVLTNNPPFSFHLENINHYMALSENPAENNLSPSKNLDNTSLGLGALGLPGDFSSASRFVKAVFVKEKSPQTLSDKESVAHFFRILQSVAMPLGSVRALNGDFEFTRYSCCANTDTGEYYYQTYYDFTLRKVSLCEENLEAEHLIVK